MNLNTKVIKALVTRDLRLYFTNPTGYVFITLFIFLSAAAAFWQSRFFLNNLANLDQLNLFFPYILLFFVPAITMGVWAEERRQGTDELLLTLPATDVEIVLGKYLSTVGIYLGALVLSFSHVIVLMWLGRPDFGLMLSNYFGYLLIGAAFIAVGMVASLLSPSGPIAFILGAIFCSIFVYFGSILGVFGEAAAGWGESLSVFDSFGEFSRGVVSLSGLLYFLSVIVTMLFVNVVLLSKRHWPREADGYKMSLHQGVRVIALLAAVIAFNVVVSRISVRLDFTAERLHSLSGETRDLLGQISDDRPVLIQAYLSKDVPKEFVQTRQNLVGFLKGIDAAAGSKVRVVVYDTEPFSEQARDAREKFGIVPIEVPGVGVGSGAQQLFMGVAFTCGAEEDVIPFFDRGLPVEYELVRSIRVVAKTDRKTIGVVTTQLKLFGGFDFNNFGSRPAWSVVGELKKQYNVQEISAEEPLVEEVDGMLVVLPSSLSQEEMDNVQAYILRGKPTMLLIDPLTVVELGLSPSEKSGANSNPFQRNQGPQPKPKGNINAFMNSIGLRWNASMVIWDGYNPHPDLASLPPEIVFVGEGSGNPDAFSPEYTATAGLQEVVLLYPGAIESAPDSPFLFEPIMQSGSTSGAFGYDQLVQRGFFGSQLGGRGLPHYPSPGEFTVGARVTGASPAETGQAAGSVNLVVLSDVDFISEQFFEIRRRGFQNLSFDNVSLFLNCMDALVEDESFISLRNRRVKHRTLETVEKRTREFYAQRAEDERVAEIEAQEELRKAQERLDQKVAEVQQRTDLDAQTKQIMARNLQEVENRRFEALKVNINADKDAKVQASREVMEGQVRSIESNIKTLAGLLPPIPVFAMGIAIFMKRRKREKEGAAAARRLRN